MRASRRFQLDTAKNAALARWLRATGRRSAHHGGSFYSLDAVLNEAVRGSVTFRHRDAQTRTEATRTMPIADFLWHVLLHVLPSGLRRVREYGFLHGKARTRLTLVQLILHVQIAARAPVPRTALHCPCCQAPMRFVGLTTRHARDG
jgi:hypothetical protein